MEGFLDALDSMSVFFSILGRNFQQDLWVLYTPFAFISWAFKFSKLHPAVPLPALSLGLLCHLMSPSSTRTRHASTFQISTAVGRCSFTPFNFLALISLGQYSGPSKLQASSFSLPSCTIPRPTLSPSSMRQQPSLPSGLP
ncbi:hypothetical protein BDP27DRAFT_216934 [Rhodocollybia butyracea]|uniref:Uncharacterized protein n=1 Tax=Rhodocollybia butyracea TaxID=206335 RepID=A0A9P5PIC0_9AGAR|nr:hypothetical protein BDP27DRAFT_216934 [Rhodocollybia butyracea]